MNGWLDSWIQYHTRTIVVREIIRQDRISALYNSILPQPTWQHGSPQPLFVIRGPRFSAAVTGAKEQGLDVLFLCSRPDWFYWWGPLDTCLNPNTWRSLCPELRLEETSGENMHISIFLCTSGAGSLSGLHSRFLLKVIKHIASLECWDIRGLCTSWDQPWLTQRCLCSF